MSRQTLDRQLHHLQDEVLLLGSMVEQSLLNATDALRRRDIVTSRRIFEDDRLINEKRYAIENAILILIATQQPMAHDLRVLAAILEVITELERIGDYGKGIAKVCVMLGDETIDVPSSEFCQMAELAVNLLHRALSAFVAEDATEAYAIPQDDQAIDDLHNLAYHKIVAGMIANPETIDHANLMMWIAHNLERAADRVTNICERTVFIATGELLEMDLDDNEEII